MYDLKIWTRLINAGFTREGAAGLMGNLHAESLLNPINLENGYERKLGYTDETYTAAVDGGKYDGFIHDQAGYGLAQWTFWTRKKALLNFAKSCKKSIGDIDMQLDFLLNELRFSYPAVWRVLTSSHSLAETSDIVILQFERPADTSPAARQRRQKYGKMYLDRFTIPEKDAKQDEPQAIKGAAEIAAEVIDGKWGNGEERKRRLTEAGYDYSIVQAAVNKMLKTATRTRYTVQMGDTLYRIAKQHGTTVEAILAQNKATYPRMTANHIEVGWELTI